MVSTRKRERGEKGGTLLAILLFMKIGGLFSKLASNVPSLSLSRFRTKFHYGATVLHPVTGTPARNRVGRVVHSETRHFLTHFQHYSRNQSLYPRPNRKDKSPAAQNDGTWNTARL